MHGSGTHLQGAGPELIGPNMLYRMLTFPRNVHTGTRQELEPDQLSPIVLFQFPGAVSPVADRETRRRWDREITIFPVLSTLLPIFAGAKGFIAQLHWIHH